MRYYNYKRTGVFARMLKALQDNPEAGRIVARLRSELLQMNASSEGHTDSAPTSSP